MRVGVEAPGRITAGAIEPMSPGAHGVSYAACVIHTPEFEEASARVDSEGEEIILPVGIGKEDGCGHSETCFLSSGGDIKMVVDGGIGSASDEGYKGFDDTLEGSSTNDDIAVIGGNEVVEHRQGGFKEGVVDAWQTAHEKSDTLLQLGCGDERYLLIKDAVDLVDVENELSFAGETLVGLHGLYDLVSKLCGVHGAVDSSEDL